MGMSLGIKKITYGPSEDQSWLASQAGTQSMDSITLDAVLCVASFPTGLVPSGIPLTRVVATGRYAPSLDNGAGVDDVAEYYLFTTADLTAGGAIAVASAVSMAASGLWQGEIIAAKVPAYAGRIPLTANTVVGLVKFV